MAMWDAMLVDWAGAQDHPVVPDVVALLAVLYADHLEGRVGGEKELLLS